MNPGVTRLAIVVALVAGGIGVLAAGFGEESDTVPPSPTSPTPTQTKTTSPSPTGGPDEVSPQQPNEVLVQVLNGTYAPGLAADFQASLEEDGYVQAGEPGDAPDKPIVDTIVYFRPDDSAKQNEADAKRLTEKHLSADVPVERLPQTYKSVTNPGANVVVVLGEDMAEAA